MRPVEESKRKSAGLPDIRKHFWPKLKQRRFARYARSMKKMKKGGKPPKNRTTRTVSLEEFSSNPTVVVTEHQGVGIRSIKVSKGKGQASPAKPKRTNKDDVYGSFNTGDGISASESLVATPVYHGRRQGKKQEFFDALAQGDDDLHSSLRSPHSGDSMEAQSPVGKFPAMYRETKCTRADSLDVFRKNSRSPSERKHSRSYSPVDSDLGDVVMRQIRDIHHDSRKSAKIIRDSKTKLLEIQKKPFLSDDDVQDLSDRNELLLREMTRFDKLTKTIQKLMAGEVTAQLNKKAKVEKKYAAILAQENIIKLFESQSLADLSKETERPTTAPEASSPRGTTDSLRCKSDVDLTRKLSESYDMQERLVADNADLEFKRYILYKELMSKDLSLETSRAQVKRLQAEIKMMHKENYLLLEKLEKNNAEGDATTMNKGSPSKNKSESMRSLEPQTPETPAAYPGVHLKKRDLNVHADVELVEKLELYKISTADLEKQLGGLEFEVRFLQGEMNVIKKEKEKVCRSAPGQSTCYLQPDGSNTAPPPLTKHCGACPPCPAPCNPTAPLTPAEREVQKLTMQLEQIEENFKHKVTECAVLRAELLKKKEELEKERCQHRDVQNKLRELEMRFEGLADATDKHLGNKEQTFDQEMKLLSLKQCYREAREEIEELRLLLKEQNDQLQDYRVKYLQAQQTVEEQKRQMDMMDMDNTRISEQINLEIQRVKLKFQEKLQELAPLPDLLKATQMRLKEAQQSQAIAEHTSESLARELNCCREKLHVIMHTMKPSAGANGSAGGGSDKGMEAKGDDKQMVLMQQRMQCLVETNTSFKQEIERLKMQVIRMEEACMVSDKRLQEKMHECAQLGGELDRARDEASRAMQRAHDRTDNMRKCLQTTVADLEKQVALAKAQVASGEKERHEIKRCMEAQIGRLNDNFEQAQFRILGLQTQVQNLRRTASSTGDGEGDIKDCACKTIFDDPVN